MPLEYQLPSSVRGRCVFEPRPGHLSVTGIDLYAHRVTPCNSCCKKSAPGSYERVKDPHFGFGEEFHKLADKGFGKAGGMNQLRPVPGWRGMFEPRLCELDPIRAREIVQSIRWFAILP